MRVVLYALLAVFSVAANELTPKAIYDSVNYYNPKLLENLLKISEYEGKQQAKQGAFDTSLKGEYFDRTKGYYTGGYLSTMLTKQISSLNMELYGGYRKGTGAHPLYEGYYLTGDEGRYIVGGEINLFRNSKVYQETVSLTNSKMDVKKMHVMYDLIRMEVIQIALTKYWEWVSKGLQLHAYRSLLDLANTRQRAIENQISHGDLAKFYAIENRQYILQRTTKVKEMQNQFDVASYQLSLYFRDAQGKMIPIAEKNLPKEMPNIATEINIENDVEHVKGVNPSLKAMKIELLQLENELKIAKAYKMPEAMLYGETYRDVGEGPSATYQPSVAYRQSRAKVGVNFKMPLERNKGKGLVVEIESRKSQIRERQIMLENQIVTELLAIKNTVSSFEQMWYNAESEFDIASKLVEMERVNVKHGNSDFFTLNLREQSEFQAKVRSIEYHAFLNISKIKYHTLMMNTDELFPKK